MLGGAMSKEAYYFSHDANARRDPKIVQMMSVYGFEGYGWYWALIEIMREQEGHKLEWTGKYFFQGLAKELSTDAERVLTFVDDCVEEFKLLRKDDTFLWAESLLKRMRKYQKQIEQRREAGKKSAQKRRENKDKLTPVERTLKPNSTNAQQLKETKGKETKGNKERIYYEDGVLNIPLKEKEYFEKAFPKKKVDAEIEKMGRWLYANPQKRYKNWKKFINSWLERAEEKKGSGHFGAAGHELEIL